MKQAYLTVDDGPSKDRKQKVDILKKYGIQAIWFSIGVDIKAREEAARYTIEKGGIIGNHSLTHPHFSELSLEKCYEEIQKADEIIEQLYEATGVVRPIKVFRFPYGDKGVKKKFYDFNYTSEEQDRIDKIQSYLNKLGYEVLTFDDIHYSYYKPLKAMNHKDWYWTYDVMEWCTFQPNHPYGIRTLYDVIDLMNLDLPEQWMGLNYEESNEIIVIHDHPETTSFFKPAIQALIEKGIRFKVYSS